MGEGERSADEDCGDLAEKVSLSTKKVLSLLRMSIEMRRKMKV